MPQMMPLSWLTLFILFSMALMLFASTNYYSHIPKTSTKKKIEVKQKAMVWKW
nr:ATP synthase F0 subunit 8 [Glyptotermes fuscus]